MAKKFGRWIIKGGGVKEGGQGQLFPVRDTEEQFQGNYILKRLKNPKRQDRFERELQSMERLKESSHIVRLVDSGAIKTEEKNYFVMEQGDGSLEELAPEDGYDPETAFHIFREICSGVMQIHNENIVHRDLKPANIILFGGRPKIGDLGLCLITELPRLTPSQEAVGPRYYMAPELEHGQNLNVDARADIYSLGKILYWALSGGVNLPRERFNERNYKLSLKRGEKSYDVFDTFFRQTLTPVAEGRTNSTSKLLEVFDECVAKFNEHPDRTFRLKLKDADLTDPATAISVSNLSPEEGQALWRWAQDQHIELGLDVLVAIGAHLDLFSHQGWLSAIDQDPKALSEEWIPKIADVFFSSDNCGVTGIRKSCDSSVLKEALRYGVNHGSNEMRNAIASDYGQFMLIEPDLVMRLLKTAVLTSESKTGLAVSIFREEFDGKIDVMKELLDSSQGNPDIFEAVIAGFVTCRNKEASAELEKALSGLREGPMFEAAVRGFAWSKEPQEHIGAMLASPEVADEVKNLLRTLCDLITKAPEPENDPDEPEA